MGRPRRITAGGLVYHVLNRGNGRMQLFNSDGDYQAFEKVLATALARIKMRLLAYCLMPNHWHMVLWPHGDHDLSRFVGWLTLTHTQRWHAFHHSVGLGHIYQGRFRSFPVQGDGHFWAVSRYVERNALRAGLVQQAEQWRWSSLWRKVSGGEQGRAILSPGPIERSGDWLAFVNQPQSEAELDSLRDSIARGRPYGSADWSTQTANLLGLRPDKQAKPGLAGQSRQ